MNSEVEGEALVPAAPSARLVKELRSAGEIVRGQFLGIDAPADKASFAVLLLPFERTTSYKKGTGRGPEALLDGSLGVELWDEEIARQTYKSGIHTVALPRGRTRTRRAISRASTPRSAS
ncbi:MAG: hypothetical protein ACRELA_07990 [Candidatus Rokuibacteriota bacterium]